MEKQGLEENVLIRFATEIEEGAMEGSLGSVSDSSYLDVFGLSNWVTPMQNPQILCFLPPNELDDSSEKKM